MRRLLTMAACAAIVTLSACGGGGGGGGGGPAVTIRDAELRLPNVSSGEFGIAGLPAPRAADARHMPVYTGGGYLFAGIDQRSAGRNLPVASERGDIDIRHGRVADGVGRATVSDYLVDAIDDDLVVRRYETAPTVRVIGPARPLRLHSVVQSAVRLVNAALPVEARMRMDSHLPEFSLASTVNRDGRYFVSDREHPNTIHVEFMSRFYSDDAGATTWNHYQGAGIRHSYIQMNSLAEAYNDDRQLTILLAHELMHALGFYGSDHVSPNFDTILEAGREIYETVQGVPQPLSLLYPVDREALQALYGRLDNGDDPTGFGPWESASLHIHGYGPHAGFGVALRNGYAEPWAYGYRPGSDLAGNRSLSGTVTWTGALLGLTPERRSGRGRRRNRSRPRHHDGKRGLHQPRGLGRALGAGRGRNRHEMARRRPRLFNRRARQHVPRDRRRRRHPDGHLRRPVA